MKQIRRHVTYANVMSSLAVFLILGGATAFAAIKKVGANEIKANSIKTGKIVKEAVTAGKLKNGAVTETKIADGAVTTNKIANDAVTGDKVKESTLGEVPNAANAANAQKVGGQSLTGLVARSQLLWAIVNQAGGLVTGSGAVSAVKLGTGDYRVTFNRTVTTCSTEGTATDITGGAAPSGAAARIVGTDNRVQAVNTTVDVTLTNDAGAVADPAAGDGFAVTVYC